MRSRRVLEWLLGNQQKTTQNKVRINSKKWVIHLLGYSTILLENKEMLIMRVRKEKEEAITNSLYILGELQLRLMDPIALYVT